MKHKNKTLTEIFLKYPLPKSEDVARKLLDIPKHTPEELGRALHSKLRLVKKLELIKQGE